MRRLTSVLFFLVLSVNIFAAELTLELNFPKKSTAKFTAPKPILEAKEVSGNLLLDIIPYPADVEEDRYLVRYFLDGQLLYETTGVVGDNPEELSFKYVFNTTSFENGRYKLIVNFWDKKGSTAMGMRQIIIKND